jgi:alkylation response protein AidB-like acyl-CoA dehydrogenase
VTAGITAPGDRAEPPDRAGLDEDTFAARLRDFLAEHHPGRPPREPGERLAFLRAWQATLTDSGWIAPGWPRRWGGMELPLPLQAVYHREMATARTPVPPTNFTGIVGPTLLMHGTDEQRERWIRPMLRADELWCQGFSEPEAGSDLASLRTRAVLCASPEGDSYRVDGRKVWTSNATIADRMLALVRTGPPGSGSRGITCLVIDMHAPGVRVSRLRDMTGGAHFAEVDLEGVEVPVTDRIGEPEQGWTAARATLGHERSTSLTAAALRYQRVVRDLVELARRRGRTTEQGDRDRLARVVTGARLLEWNGRRVLAQVLEGGAPGPLSSVSRLQHGLFEQSLHECALEMLGPDGMLDPRDPRLSGGTGTGPGNGAAGTGPGDGAWVRGFLRTRASTIGAGTAEIQRSTIAEKVLGLPADASEREDR